MTGGGIDFKIGSKWKFENIFLSYRGSVEEWGELGPSWLQGWGGSHEFRFGTEGPKQVTPWSTSLTCPFSEAWRLKGRGSLALAVTGQAARGQDRAPCTAHASLPGTHLQEAPAVPATRKTETWARFERRHDALWLSTNKINAWKCPPGRKVGL